MPSRIIAPAGALDLPADHLPVAGGKVDRRLGPRHRLQRRRIAGELLGAQEATQLIGMSGRVVRRADPEEPRIVAVTEGTSCHGPLIGQIGAKLSAHIRTYPVASPGLRTTCETLLE